ncbi:MAG: gfo/Idh/MocA family oxidoreductase, partial [Aliifodinibius sp.]|nr:gfo/Idh/MocA family oxidoreductase [Fodinibius sp.]NIW42541.1 gfo/Idh/MocA family oxidoreductase [candidate division Zixibacteria bacterium]NIY30580.1 gfo/Idh/MocA family oxidoreductase [Fodinibius sp.]
METFKGKEQNVTGDLEEISITTEDAASLLLQFENGTRGVFMVSQVSAGRKNRFWIEIDGSKQALSWNQEEPNKLWLGFREKANQEVI